MNADIVKCERMQDFLDGFFVFTATRAYGFETIKMFYFLCLISEAPTAVSEGAQLTELLLFASIKLN